MNAVSFRLHFAVGSLVLMTSGDVSIAQDAILSTEPVDPMTLTLVPVDLNQATASMIRYDRNDDGKIDREEWTRLRWDDDKVRRFDVNRDGKLTHVEMAIHHAEIRRADGIEAADSKYAENSMKRFDTNKNGRLDAAEIKAKNWPRDWEDYDKDGDGNITLMELMKEFAFRRGLRRELGIISIDINNANRLLREHDKNLDGKLSADEAASARLKIDDEDHDEDGKLGAMEVATIYAKRRMETGISAKDQYEAQNTFTMLDKDRDGSITADELGNTGAEQLMKADTNRDGKISGRELQSYYAAASKKRGYSDSHLAAARRIIMRYDTDRDETIGARLVETSDAGAHYNTYVVAMPSGKVASHRKIDRFVSEQMESGDEYTVFDIPQGARVGVLICYDNNIGENVRITVLEGAEILLAPHQTGGCDSPSMRGVVGRTASLSTTEICGDSPDASCPTIFDHRQRSRSRVRFLVHPKNETFWTGLRSRSPAA